MITRIQPGARMSEAVIHGNTVYLAGQVGEPGDDVTAQTKTTLAEIEAFVRQHCDLYFKTVEAFGDYLLHGKEA